VIFVGVVVDRRRDSSRRGAIAQYATSSSGSEAL
jgi:hypothetical protein